VEAFAGRYQLIDLVGTGGMGSVWRAWDLRREAYVAAKVLGQHDAATLLRFVREQSLRIEHPHVMAPHGWAADDDKVVFAMDLVRGGSVATLLGDHGPLPASYVAVLLDQLLHGLSAVHAAGIVHRDLKPANLLLDATGTAYPHLRLSDFGIAGLLDEPRMTRHSTVLGTPGYIAPEQLAGADPDPRQDLYTVGAVAAELLTGVRPETNGNLPPADHGPLSDLVLRLTAKDPASRPASAAEAGRLLAATGVLPPAGTAPWSTQPDPPEVFDQLPPLPPHYSPTGPIHPPPPHPSRSGANSGLPTPGTFANPPASSPTSDRLPASTPEQRAPAANTPERQVAGANTPERQVAGANTPERQVPAEHTPERPVPAASSPVEPVPFASTPAGPVPAANTARSGAAAAGEAPSIGQVVAGEAPSGEQAAGRRGLMWVAVGSFAGAAVLAGAAVWLLLR
jgi:serine/threonine-protein kinase